MSHDALPAVVSDDSARGSLLDGVLGARQPAALAAAAWTGAEVPGLLPLSLALPAVLVAVVVIPHWSRWCLVALVVTSVGGERALDGLDVQSEARFAGTVTLVTDPEVTPDGRARVDVRADGKRLLALARAPAAIEVLEGRLAGERVAVRGERSTFDAPADWMLGRHLAGRLTIDAVDAVGGAAPHAAAANRFRQLLDDGAASLAPGDRALLAGLTLGDDRAQPPGLAADFRAAGLTHLLAVSGQNVVFLLVVLRPLLSRVRLWPRFVLASGAVVAFAFVTRFEPSVLRAAAVAVIAVGARTIGRSGGGIRHLCLAVAALVVIDPLLTRSIGFRLSVAACAGVLLLAPRIAACVPGPRWFAEGLGVTAGAQLAVAPVLVPAFGPMPLAALPANVLAGPLAAFLMMWGVTAGMVAGAVGGEVAWLLHRPSALGLGALDRVAAGAAALPLGSIDLRHVLVVALCWACWWFLGRRGRATIVVLLCVALASAAVQPGARSEHLAGWGARVWTDGPVAVVALDPGASAVEVLDVVRRRHVSRVGAVVVGSDRPSLAVVADAIAARVPVGAVLVPEAAVHVDGVTPGVGEEIRVAGLSVVAERVTPTLRVRIGPARSG